MQIETFHWGGLSCRVVHDLPDGQPPPLAVVLCHGFGAPGTDLVGLAQPLLMAEAVLAERAVFLFPVAPLDLAAQGMPGGRAWWLVDLERLINRPTPDLLDRFRRECPVGM